MPSHRRSLAGGATLVLNVGFEPLNIIPHRRAVVLVYSERAELVEPTNLTARSERQELQVPSVIRLSRYIRVPYRATVPLTRTAVVARDKHRCVYCGGKPETIDHVVPRSRGGQHAWTNVVAACQKCNHKKGNRLLAELGWSLREAPAAPKGAVPGFVSGEHPSAWRRYLGLAEERGHFEQRTA
ncbi:MAG: HNH endonuclease [Segniliparus sp.]|uniref:HNH endonuclease n=1 Tax=Segniliparus sp. TaxID=2804064 RepID=UPI003F3141C3